MANAKISDLPAVTAINGADLAVVVQGGTTSQASVDNLFTDRTLVAPALGTPASGNLSNCTALPVGSVTGLGTGVATFLATPSSANLASAVTGETGTGALVFGTGPTIAGPVLTLKSYVVGSLPAAASSTGVVAYVTDADTPVLGATVVGGAAAKAMVWSNGANWTVTGV